jgi:hypothetical protein
METLYQHTVAGQDVAEEELNWVAETAAKADDHVIAELLRMIPGLADGYVHKAVLPYRVEALHPDGVSVNTTAIVTPYGTTGSVLIHPFRALIGSRYVASSSTWYDIRTARYLGNIAPVFSFQLELTATVSNSRWDLIYARVDLTVTSAAVERIVRSGGGDAPQNISLYTDTTVTIGVVEGAESATPVEPTLPSDGSDTYYIPLAYVLLVHPFTSSTAVEPTWICEHVPVAPIASSTGAVTCRPASFAYADDSSLWSRREWGPADTRPEEHLPATMIGGAQRFIALDFMDVTKSIPPDVAITMDNTIDWRNRVLTFTVYGNAVAGRRFAWMPTSTPLVELEPAGEATVFIGNTFNTAMPALTLNSTSFPIITSDSSLLIGIAATGELTVEYVSGTTPLLEKYCILVQATGQFTNAK